MMPPGVLFFIKIALAVRSFLWFHTDFRIVPFFVKDAIGILVGIALIYIDCFGYMDIVNSSNP